MILRRILPHLCLVISIMMLVFYVIDTMNDAMGFLRGEVFRTLLLIYCIVAILTSIILIVVNEKSR